MVPPSITKRLTALRQRELFQRFAWGLARVLAAACVVFVVACLVDWVVDRFQDTPGWLRVSLLVGQIVLFLGLFAFLVVRPLAAPLEEHRLALWVEERHPRLRHRLISAVQFHQPGADVQGMSLELIDVVTREAEEHVARVDVEGIVDNRRLWRGLAFFLPALVVLILPFVIWSSVFPVLARRQFLAGDEIPRSVYLHVASNTIWPRGEKVRLELRATGPGVENDPAGELTVHWRRDDKAPSRLALDRVSLKNGEAVYAVDIPASDVDFTYTAWLGDGRLRQPGEVKYVPRPDARETAFVRLPEFCGKTPSGQVYELSASRGDIEGIAGSSVRVVINVQKPVEKALLHLFTRKHRGFDEAGNTLWDDVPRGSLNIAMDESKKLGAAIFALEPRKGEEPYTHYTVEVADEHGFGNVPRPMRNLRVIPEPRPEVALLREQFPPEFPVPPRFAELYVHSGMPAREGDKIRVGYKAFGPYGLGAAFLQYRKITSPVDRAATVRRFLWTIIDLPGEEKEEDWTELLLPEETRINPRTGKEEDLGEFLPEQGVFERTPPEKSVGFYAVPSHDPHVTLGRIRGGGRYDLELKGLITRAGKPLTLKKGDQIEYRIKIYADRNVFADRPWNVSETRVTTIEDSTGVWDWLTTNWAEQDRIRALEKSQRGVFEKSK